LRIIDTGGHKYEYNTWQWKRNAGDWNRNIARGEQKMIDESAAERMGSSDEIAEAGAFLLGDKLLDDNADGGIYIP